MPVFRHRTELDHPVEEVFSWHRRPGAFERLAPPWQSVQVRRRTGGIADGGEVELALRKGPATLRWVVKHTAYEENRYFRDEQVSGPFRRWVHEHRFEPLDDGRSAVEDVVEWEAPLGTVGRTFSGGFIQRTLERLFAFRHRRLAHDLARHRSFQGDGPLTVAVTGSSGFVGGALVPFLTAGGHRVLRLVRDPSRADGDGVHWDVHRRMVEADKLEGVDAVVHLAGEPIAGVRWTAAKKRAILESREEGTRLLARTLAGLTRPPRAFVSASGVDIYGDRGDEAITEGSKIGEGFLADVCRAWEAATQPAAQAGIRVVRARTGMVLSPAGGALGTMLLPFRLGLGGRLGSGRQYVSWIDHDDHVALLFHALTNPGVEGPLNATAPFPVPNATFTATLGRVLGRPTFVPAPAAAVRLALGEMGEELLLQGARVLPRKARETGFEFAFPALEDSLRHQMGRPEGAPVAEAV